MNQIIKELRAWGCDVDSAMEWMLDDEDFYINCLNTTLDDPNFAMLKKALEGRNVLAAFNSSHTLKGLTAMLGLTPMYNKITEIVEPLRTGNCDNLAGKLDELEKLREHMAEILQRS